MVGKKKAGSGFRQTINFSNQKGKLCLPMGLMLLEARRRHDGPELGTQWSFLTLTRWFIFYYIVYNILITLKAPNIFDVYSNQAKSEKDAESRSTAFDARALDEGQFPPVHSAHRQWPDFPTYIAV